MPLVKWDQIGERTYESGLDRGVLYLPNGSAVPWNGLTKVSEKFDKSTEPIFYDGVKITDIVTLGTFSASLSALTYPKRLDEVEGNIELRNGVYLGEQPGGTFGICYRTRVGNDVDGDTAGYKIHVVYNITAIPSDRDYQTTSDNLEAVEFEWELIATPEHLEGYRPSSHLVIKTEELDPWLLADIEEVLYGTSLTDASLIPMDELVSMINNWFRIKITDNGDGTWTAESPYDDFIFLFEDSSFQIQGANATYTDPGTYILSDTKDISDVPRMSIKDNGDGTWTAMSEMSGDIVITGTTFAINNGNVDIVDVNTYQISDALE